MKFKTTVVMRRVVDGPALYREIGRRIRVVRNRRGMSQETLGLALGGMTRANIANLEGGKSRILLEHIYNAALALKVPLRELLP